MEADRQDGRPTLTVPLDSGLSLPTGAAKSAVEELGRRIANDLYRPGEPIPTEPELAASLGVSRATVRDAIKVLSGKGLIRTARRYGTRVRPIEEWNLLDADVASWHDPTHPRIGRMFAETTELRCIIEPAAAALAAERATLAQTEAISAAANAMHPGKSDVAEMFAADCTFHATILEATGNMMMRQLKPIILTVLRISYEFGVLVKDGEPVTREGHIHVADAIGRRDSSAARTEMEHMLQNNRRTAEQYWSRKASQGSS
ncbi:FadR/GntR family transcriptional regulator [Tropicimonas sp. IMCC6043]|uniref:FadR/GntR family transcriptional regulator n=1 Tax=Tropicimonas sp. IMCC6043 TaxID=2510645 RepID=UPI00101C04D3|nr:FCD domain-containing protein [Tropicimonas sp. IMCC6043]RYH06493.1 FadR family transcriptional regulator [Tropicimonas sp. IMCC6043]